MEKFRAWTVIIIFILLLLYLFRNVIKRVIFFLILLGIAFFIYGLISPSGADKVWYYVSNIPSMISSFFGGEKFVTYDKYQGEQEIENNLNTEDNYEDNNPSNEKEESDSDNEEFIGKMFSFHSINYSQLLAQRIDTIPVISKTNTPQNSNQGSNNISNNQQNSNSNSSFQNNIPNNQQNNTNNHNYPINNTSEQTPTNNSQSSNQSNNNINACNNNYCNTRCNNTCFPCNKEAWNDKKRGKKEQKTEAQRKDKGSTYNGLSREEIEETQRLFDILLG